MVLCKAIKLFLFFTVISALLLLFSCGCERAIETDKNDKRLGVEKLETREINYGTIVGEIAHIHTEQSDKPILVWFDDEKTAKEHVNSILVVYLSNAPVRLCGVKTFGSMLYLEVATNDKSTIERERIRRRIKAGMKVYMPPIPKNNKNNKNTRTHTNKNNKRDTRTRTN